MMALLGREAGMEHDVYNDHIDDSISRYVFASMILSRPTGHNRCLIIKVFVSDSGRKVKPVSRGFVLCTTSNKQLSGDWSGTREIVR